MSVIKSKNNIGILRSIKFKMSLWYTVITFTICFFLTLMIYISYSMNDFFISVSFVDDTTGINSIIRIITMIIEDPRYILTPGTETVWIYLGLALAFVLPLSFASGLILANAFFNPIEKIRRTAEKISSQDLQQRIQLKDTKDEVKALADTFDDMLDRIDHAYSLQKQFIQDASHELKTPLSIIQTNLDVLEANSHKTVHDYHAVFETVERSTQRLTKLTRDLLFLTREKVVLEKKKINLNELIKTVVKDIEPKIRMEKLKIDLIINLKEHLKILGDKSWLEKLFFNIIDNSIKYNKRGGWIKIELGKDSNNAFVSIIDNGQGIEKSELDRIFERFYRTDRSRSREKGGSGLGLAICKKIVENHNGNIKIKSLVRKGTTVSISLPLIGN
ncbi:MAG: HAMP domain-containing sensor histidine kinase [Candidatus Dojkabacteria bacterium]|nr:HAMP domain-containing sensor histidine kinase [Candidatus Dojkabacteria bacterium]